MTTLTQEQEQDLQAWADDWISLERSKHSTVATQRPHGGLDIWRGGKLNGRWEPDFRRMFPYSP